MVSNRSYAGPERRAGQRVGLAPLLAAALDEVDHGLLLLRQDRSVVFANHAARRALASQSLLQVASARLEARLPQDDAALSSAVAEACCRGVRRLVRLSSALGSMELSVAPLRGALSTAVGPQACLLKLGRTELAPDLSITAFGQMHGLSTREREVLSLLCRGSKPVDIAQALELSLATVRTHINNLRRKAQAPDVVSLICTVVAVPSVAPALRDDVPDVRGESDWGPADF